METINYELTKKIIKNGKKYDIQINIPNKFNDIVYHIYGSLNFHEYGKFKISKNNNLDNILTFEINEVQIIFISIYLKKENKTIYDFIDMKNFISINNYKKNIKIYIKKKINNDYILDEINKLETESNLLLKLNEEDSDEEDSDEEDSDEEDSNKEDSSEEDSDEEDSEKENLDK
jgi:hypothetical protein